MAADNILLSPAWWICLSHFSRGEKREKKCRGQISCGGWWSTVGGKFFCLLFEFNVSDAENSLREQLCSGSEQRFQRPIFRPNQSCGNSKEGAGILLKEADICWSPPPDQLGSTGVCVCGYVCVCARARVHSCSAAMCAAKTTPPTGWTHCSHPPQAQLST